MPTTVENMQVEGFEADDATIEDGAVDVKEVEGVLVGGGAAASEAAEDGAPDGEAGEGEKAATRARGAMNKELGRRGERAAEKFLVRRGYDVVARNWTCPAGEADLVVRDESSIVFVEVKTRTSVEKGLPEEAVGREKRSKYERIAAFFLSDYPYTDMFVRFDVISILVMHEDRAFVRHHINAFGVG